MSSAAAVDTAPDAHETVAAAVSSDAQPMVDAPAFRVFPNPHPVPMPPPFALPTGLLYLPDFLSLSEQAATVAALDARPYQRLIHRRQQFYGQVYYHTPQCPRSTLQPLEGAAAIISPSMNPSDNVHSANTTNTNTTIGDRKVHMTSTRDAASAASPRNHAAFPLAPLQWLVDRALAAGAFEPADRTDVMAEYARVDSVTVASARGDNNTGDGHSDNGIVADPDSDSVNPMAGNVDDEKVNTRNDGSGRPRLAKVRRHRRLSLPHRGNASSTSDINDSALSNYAAAVVVGAEGDWSQHSRAVS